MSLVPPTGNKYDPVDPKTIDECWITPTDFPNLIAYSQDSQKSTILNNMIITACGAVNRLCNRKFNQQIIDEIWPNVYMYTSMYNEFTLKNRPLVEVEHVWLQIAANFSEVYSTYLQILTEESIVKILPTVMTTALVPYPFYLKKDACNVWVEYKSGYKIDRTDLQNIVNDVPYDVQLATSLYVDYLYSSFDMTAGITSFKTQTYSQTGSTPDNDPKLQAIKALLRPYMLISVK